MTYDFPKLCGLCQIYVVDPCRSCRYINYARKAPPAVADNSNWHEFNDADNCSWLNQGFTPSELTDPGSFGIA